MKKLAFLLLLGTFSIYGESVLDQIKNAVAKAQEAAKQVINLKKDLESCRTEVSGVEEREKANVQAKDEAYKLLLADKFRLVQEKEALSQRIKTLEDKLKSSTRTGPPAPPPGAFDQTGSPAPSSPKGRPAQDRNKLLEEIRKGKALKKPWAKGNAKPGSSKPVAAKPGTPKTMQQELAEQLAKRRGSVEPEEEDNDNGEWAD